MRNRPNIIIFGTMGSGKTTAGNYLKTHYGYKVMHLGEKIHSECRLHGDETREEMQAYGQAMRQIFGIDVWCDYLYKRIDDIPVVIDDGRQENEFAFFKGRGFITLGISADYVLRYARLSKRESHKINEDSFKHDTEIQAFKCYTLCDYMILNNGTLEDLSDEMEYFVNGWCTVR